MLPEIVEGTKECCNLNRVVRENYLQLLNYLKKQTGDNELAEDIAQDVMLKLVRAHNGSQPLANPAAWLFQVAKNQLSDHYRKKKLVLVRDDDGDFPDITGVDIFPETMPEDILPLMVDLLPSKYSKPLIMRDINKCPVKDIANRQDISIPAAKMRVRRARKMLLELFYECCEIEFSKSGGFAGCTVKDNCRPLSVESRGFRHR